MNPTVAELIESLSLQPHPEGGFYRETWRSPLVLPESILPDCYQGIRAAGTAILFLLPTGSRSKPHRVHSDELWLHQAGDPVELRVTSSAEGSTDPMTYHLGQDHCFQALVPGGSWQEAVALPGNAGYGLVGCIVVPGFDFADFELEIPTSNS